MLVGGGVKDKIRAVFFKNIRYALLVPYGAYKHIHSVFYLRAVAQKLLLDFICVVFVNIKNYQPAYGTAGKLAAKLAAYASAAAGNKHRGAAQVVFNALAVNFYRFAPQKILNFNFSDLAYADLSACKLIKPRYCFKAALSAAADVKNFFALGVCRRGNGKNYVLNAEFFRRFFNFIAPAHNFYVFYVFAVLLHVVIYDADHLVFGTLASVKLAYGHKAGGTRSDYHCAAAGGADRAVDVARRAV